MVERITFIDCGAICAFEGDVADQKRWFKVWTSLLIDMDNMPPEDIGQWVRLGCRIALVGNHGTVEFDDWSHVARFFNVLLADVKALLKRLPSVSFEEGKSDNCRITVTLKNWLKYQVDSTVGERVKRLRSKRRGEEKREEEKRDVVKNNNGFDIFWKEYPSKIAKGAALKAWKKLRASPELLRKILDAISKQKQSSRWLKNNGEYIPNPTTWLNQGRWEDEVEATEKVDDPWHRYE